MSKDKEEKIVPSDEADEAMSDAKMAAYIAEMNASAEAEAKAKEAAKKRMTPAEKKADELRNFYQYIDCATRFIRRDNFIQEHTFLTLPGIFSGNTRGRFPLYSKEIADLASEFYSFCKKYENKKIVFDSGSGGMFEITMKPQYIAILTLFKELYFSAGTRTIQDQVEDRDGRGYSAGSWKVKLTDEEIAKISTIRSAMDAAGIRISIEPSAGAGLKP